MFGDLQHIYKKSKIFIWHQHLRLGMTAPFQKAIIPLGNELKPDRWIFIVGCYNSGTTLLREILSVNRKIDSLPVQGSFLTDGIPLARDFGCPRLWYKCLNEIREKFTKNPKTLAKRIQTQWSYWYPNQYENLLEKSIVLTTQMEYLQKYFKPAYFIHIVRNGYAVAEGIQRRTEGHQNMTMDSYPIEMCARQWVKSLKVVRESRKNIDRFIELKYEDLCDNPESVIENILKFLSIESLNVSLQDRIWDVQAKNEAIKNFNPRSFNRLTLNEKEIIRTTAKQYLNEYNYTPS